MSRTGERSTVVHHAPFRDEELLNTVKSDAERGGQHFSFVASIRDSQLERLVFEI